MGRTSQPRTVTLTNPNGVDLNTGSIEVTGSGFQISNDTCAGKIPANNQCFVQVTLTPPATGSQKGTLTIHDFTGTKTYNVKVTGVGM